MTSIHFHSNLLFSGKDRSLPLELRLVRAPLWLGTTLRAKIRLGWKCLTMANTLAYNVTALNTTVTNFILQVSGEFITAVIVATLY